MSKVNSEINYSVTAKDAGASKTFSGIGQAAREMTDSVKSSLGEESTFGRIGKILSGAGAVAGLTVMGRLLNNAADKAAMLTEQFSRGEIGVQKMVAELAKSLPIYGELIAAGEKFGKLLDRQGAREAERQTQGQNNTDIFGNSAASMAGAFAGVAGAAAPTKLDPTQMLEARVNAARELVQKANADALAALENQLAAEKEALRTSYKDEEDLILGKIAALEQKKLALAKLTAGALIKVEAARIAEESRLRTEANIAAGVEAAKAESEAINARRATQKKLDQLAEEAKRESEAINKKRRGLEARFAEEDYEDGLNARRDELQKRISGMEANKPRSGATADTVTDTGRGAILAGMERRSQDPQVKELTMSRKQLELITKELKELNNAQKQRSRSNQTGGAGVFE